MDHCLPRTSTCQDPTTTQRSSPAKHSCLSDFHHLGLHLTISPPGVTDHHWSTFASSTDRAAYLPDSCSVEPSKERSLFGIMRSQPPASSSVLPVGTLLLPHIDRIHFGAPQKKIGSHLSSPSSPQLQHLHALSSHPPQHLSPPLPTPMASHPPVACVPITLTPTQTSAAAATSRSVN